MRTAKTVSITLPPDLLAKAQEFAELEHRTMSELFREALRSYITGNTNWESLLERTRAQGRNLGIRSEADVERLSDEHRRHKNRDWSEIMAMLDAADVPSDFLTSEDRSQPLPQERPGLFSDSGDPSRR